MKVLIRTLQIGTLVAVAALALSAAALGANAQVFTDPFGDNEGAGTPSHASDITQVEVRSADDGNITFAVTLHDGPGRLVGGDSLGISIDTTGEGIADFALLAMGNDSAPPNFHLCDIRGASPRCELDIGGEDRPIAPGIHVVTFGIVFSNWTVISFQVISEFAGRRDIAPNAGVFVFDVNADPDRDGLTGAGDRCPTVHRGKYDTDDDGCPGPFPRLARPGHKLFGNPSGSGILVRDFRVTNAPKGTVVTVRWDRRSAVRRGSGVIRQLVNQRLAAGTRITIIYSRPGHIGSYKVLRVTASGVRVVRAGCTNVGGRKLTRCPVR